MPSSENESQTEESSSDEEQENEYDEMKKLMENLAPYNYEPERAISFLSEGTESSENKLQVTMLLAKTRAISWDK